MSRDDEHPELPPVPAGDARVVVEVGHLELAAPGVGRRRPEVVRDAGHLQRRQLRQAALRLHRRLLERDLHARGPCTYAHAAINGRRRQSSGRERREQSRAEQRRGGIGDGD